MNPFRLAAALALLAAAAPAFAGPDDPGQPAVKAPRTTEAPAVETEKSGGVLPGGGGDNETAVNEANQTRLFAEFMKDYIQASKAGQLTPEKIRDLAVQHQLDPHSKVVRDRLRKISKAADELFAATLGDAGKKTAPEPIKPGRVAGGGQVSGGERTPAPNVVSPALNYFDNENVSATGGSPESLRDRGFDLRDQGDYRGAFRDLDRVIGTGQPDQKTLDAYGDAAYHLGDYATAHNAALLALQINPNDRDALTLVHFTEGRAPVVALPSSLGELGQGRAPESLNGGGSANGGGGVMSASFQQAPARPAMTAEQAAAEANRQALAAGPDAVTRSAQFTKDAANAMRVKDYPTAYQLATNAVTLNPQNAQALNFRAMTLTHLSRYPEAEQDASAALTLAPGNAAALTTRSWAFSKEKKYKEALDDARAAVAAEPENSYAFQTEALALAGLGDRDGTLDALRRSAQLDHRWTGRLERALQLPQNADMTLLFDDAPAQTAAAPAPRAPADTPRRFLRLALLTSTGGLLIALGVLHIVSASWREKMRMTVRRVLGPSPVAAGAAAASAPADGPSAGAFWTQYELVKEIGLGGMGVVYEALDRSLERRVAVKKMRDEIRLDPDDRRRFVTEARTVAQLHHPNIVDVYGIVEDGPEVYLVFEFVPGRTLQDALKSGGPMELSKAAALLREMCAAVAHAHEKNIIHRDLKPSNVMVTPEGRVKVMDFGIARQAKDAMTRHSMTNTIAGTPPYMAPEQEQGNVRKESDVYALGVCLYEMVTGHLPFNGSGAAMLLNKLNGKLIAPSARSSALPPALDDVVARALNPDPDKRYRTPEQLAAAVDALVTTARA